MSTKSQEVQKHEDEMDVAENAQHESALGDQYLDGTGLEGVDMTELDGGEAGEGKSEFPAMTAKQLASTTPGAGYLKVNVPPNRYTPLKNAWMDIYNPIVEHMKISIRFDPKKRCVELKTNDATEMPGALQKCADFVKAFTLGFEIRDAIALLRLDDLYIDRYVACRLRHWSYVVCLDTVETLLTQLHSHSHSHYSYLVSSPSPFVQL